MKLASGTASAQVLALIATPFIVRLFAPSAFGIQALFVSLTTVLSVVICLRYEVCVMLPASDEESANAVAVSLFFAVLMTLGFAALLWLGAKPLLGLLKAPELLRYLWLAPIYLFTIGVHAGNRIWNIRKGHYVRVTAAEVTSSFVSLSVQLIAGFTHHGTEGYLIAAVVLGLMVAASVLAYQTWRDYSGIFLGSVRWQRMRQVIQHYARFPKYSTASTLLNNLSWQMPAFVLSSFFSTFVVGQYALGSRVMRVPMSLVGTTVGQVFFQRAAERHHSGELAASVETSFRYLMGLTLFPCLLLALVGRDVFIVLFGRTWAEAGVYMQILSVWTCFWFISAPLSALFDVLQEQAFAFRLSVVILLTRVASLMIGGFLHSPRLALALFASTGVLVYGYTTYALLNLAGVPRKTMLKVMIPHLLAFLPCGAIIMTLYLFSMPPLVVVAISILLLAAYYLNFIRTDPAVRGSLGNTLRQLRPVRNA